MRISFGLSAARSAVGSSPANSVEAMRERRVKMDMCVLHWRHACAWPRLMEAGKKARRQLCLGGAHALAAFLKRPQADRSNRRYEYSTRGAALASTRMNLFHRCWNR